MENWLLTPPIAFFIVFVFIGGISYLFSFMAYRPKKIPHGAGESYACGESSYDNMAQPDYTQFFPFAFFFTIAHVATLMLITVPLENKAVMIMALFYLLAVVVGLFILLGRTGHENIK
jgi:NADH-quinone oxidoreductase subunit A